MSSNAPEISRELLETLMDRALIQAARAGEAGEVPVGAVLYAGGRILCESYNLTEKLHDPTAHAEILAIRKAGELVKNWRLSDAILCVTLEPCTMCAGAIRAARIPTIVFGAADERVGAAGSLFDVVLDPRLGPPPRLIEGVRKDEASRLLRGFFEEKRR